MLSAWYGTADFVKTHADAVRRFAAATPKRRSGRTAPALAKDMIAP
jgi:hypothetical protein